MYKIKYSEKHKHMSYEDVYGFEPRTFANRHRAKLRASELNNSLRKYNWPGKYIVYKIA